MAYYISYVEADMVLIKPVSFVQLHDLAKRLYSQNE